MKAVILAGGFGKRLGELTKNTPKPLLPIAGKPIIDYIVEKMEDVEDIDFVYVLTIRKFEDKFRSWLTNLRCNKEIRLSVQPTMDESQNLGTIGGLNFFIKMEHLDDALLIVAGDNLFDFSLVNFVDFFKDRKAPIVACFDMKDKERVKGRYGVVAIDDDSRIIDLQEKPQNPRSSLASTACYLFPRHVLDLVSDYLNETNNPDAPGYFMSWLCQREPSYGFIFSGWWFDIGDLDSYSQADLFLKSFREGNYGKRIL